MRILPASDSALLVTFGDCISLEAHHNVIALFRALQQIRDPRIRNLHPAYASLLVDFDTLAITHREVETLVLSLSPETASGEVSAAEPTEIPVCYEAEFAPDLATVAEHLQFTEEQLVSLHAAGEYRVYFLGFSPGFAYMGGSAQIRVPRLDTPRVLVKAGSVGLAGEQTGIYPNDSPGGWQIIGRTPLRMFDPSRSPESRLRPGDRVRFRRITSADFMKMESNEVQNH